MELNVKKNFIKIRDKISFCALDLKIIAYISMFTDHFSRGIFYYYIRNLFKSGDIGSITHLTKIYDILRDIGRLAFPLFCFLLVEGCIYTAKSGAYLLRLFMFALLSEIPFNLMLSLHPFYPEHQNVMWTLFWGAALIIISRSFEPPFIIKAALMVLVAYITFVFKTDYKICGAALIFILYIFRYNEGFKEFAGFIVFLSFTKNIWCFPAFILMYFYNGKKQRDPDPNGIGNAAGFIFGSRFSYLLYPLHMLINYFIARGFAL